MTINDLPTLNVILNGTSACLLFFGWRAIKKRNIELHKKLMLSAFIVSSLFLTSYLIYHFNVVLITTYKGQGFLRIFYYSVLATHIPLAALTLPFIFAAFWYAFRQEFSKHTRITRWLLPAWFYVSVTGVLIYLMLYVF